MHLTVGKRRALCFVSYLAWQAILLKWKNAAFQQNLRISKHTMIKNEFRTLFTYSMCDLDMYTDIFVHKGIKKLGVCLFLNKKNVVDKSCCQ